MKNKQVIGLLLSALLSISTVVAPVTECFSMGTVAYAATDDDTKDRKKEGQKDISKDVDFLNDENPPISFAWQCRMATNAADRWISDGYTVKDLTSEGSIKASECAPFFAYTEGEVSNAKTYSKSNGRGKQNSASSVIYSYSDFAKAELGKIGDNDKYSMESNFGRYALYGRYLNLIGFDQTGAASEKSERTVFGSAFLISYYGAMAVNSFMDMGFGMLTATNPFQFFEDLGTDTDDGLIIEPEKTKAEEHQGEAKSGFTAIKKFVGDITKLALEIGWKLAIPLCLVFLIAVYFISNGRSDIKSGLKKFAIRVLFVGIGIPLCGSAYTQMLKAVAATNDFDNAFINYMVVSSLVDFEAWVDNSRIDPAALKITSDSGKATEGTKNPRLLLASSASSSESDGSGKLIAASGNILQIRQMAYSLNKANKVTAVPDTDSMFKVSKDGVFVLKPDTSSDALLPKAQEAIKPNDGTGSGSESSSEVIAGADLIRRYMSGSQYAATSFEGRTISKLKSGVNYADVFVTASHKYSFSPESDIEVKWLSKSSSGGSEGDTEKDTYGEIAKNRFKDAGDKPSTAGETGGAEKRWTNGCNLSTGAASTQVDFMGSNVGSPNKGLDMSEDDLGLSTMSMYVYLSSSFEEDGVVVYGGAPSVYTQKQHYSVNLVGTNYLMRLAFTLNFVAICGGYFILAFFFIFRTVFECIIKGFDVITHAILGTMGLYRSMGKALCATISMMAELLVTVMFYGVSIYMMFLSTTLIDGFFQTIFKKVFGSANPYGSNPQDSFTAELFVIMGCLVSAAAVVFFVAFLIRWRGYIIASINETVERAVGLLFGESMAGASSGLSTVAAGAMSDVKGVMGTAAAVGAGVAAASSMEAAAFEAQSQAAPMAETDEMGNQIDRNTDYDNAEARSLEDEAALNERNRYEEEKEKHMQQMKNAGMNPDENSDAYKLESARYDRDQALKNGDQAVADKAQARMDAIEAKKESSSEVSEKEKAVELAKEGGDEAEIKAAEAELSEAKDKEADAARGNLETINNERLGINKDEDIEENVDATEMSTDENGNTYWNFGENGVAGLDENGNLTIGSKDENGNVSGVKLGADGLSVVNTNEDGSTSETKFNEDGSVTSHTENADGTSEDMIVDANGETHMERTDANGNKEYTVQDENGDWVTVQEAENGDVITTKTDAETGDIISTTKSANGDVTTSVTHTDGTVDTYDKLDEVEVEDENGNKTVLHDVTTRTRTDADNNVIDQVQIGTTADGHEMAVTSFVDENGNNVTETNIDNGIATGVIKDGSGRAVSTYKLESMGDGTYLKTVDNTGDDNVLDSTETYLVGADHKAIEGTRSVVQYNDDGSQTITSDFKENGQIKQAVTTMSAEDASHNRTFETTVNGALRNSGTQFGNGNIEQTLYDSGSGQAIGNYSYNAADRSMTQTEFVYEGEKRVGSIIKTAAKNGAVAMSVDDARTAGIDIANVDFSDYSSGMGKLQTEIAGAKFSTAKLADAARASAGNIKLSMDSAGGIENIDLGSIGSTIDNGAIAGASIAVAGGAISHITAGNVNNGSMAIASDGANTSVAMTNGYGAGYQAVSNGKETYQFAANDGYANAFSSRMDANLGRVNEVSYVGGGKTTQIIGDNGDIQSRTNYNDFTTVTRNTHRDENNHVIEDFGTSTLGMGSTTSFADSGFVSAQTRNLNGSTEFLAAGDNGGMVYKTDNGRGVTYMRTEDGRGNYAEEVHDVVHDMTTKTIYKDGNLYTTGNTITGADAAVEYTGSVAAQKVEFAGYTNTISTDNAKGTSDTKFVYPGNIQATFAEDANGVQRAVIDSSNIHIAQTVDGLNMSTTATGPNGFTGYRTADGVTVPQSVIINNNGQPVPYNSDNVDALYAGAMAKTGYEGSTQFMQNVVNNKLNISMADNPELQNINNSTFNAATITTNTRSFKSMLMNQINKIRPNNNSGAKGYASGKSKDTSSRSDVDAFNREANGAAGEGSARQSK